MKIKSLIIAFLLVTQLSILFAQSPKHELRSTWLTTVWRLDWPSVTVPAATGTNDAERQVAIQQQKNELISIFEKLKAANMNAVYLQVRSMCDAFYQSSYEPWSAFVSANRGANPGYDPLSFAVEEAHKRGIELHAWLNPYRYSTSSTTHGELPTDYYYTHRNWLLAYDSYTKILNPGLPEVVLQIKKVVGEIVNNYDVDGVVFDDYFYAYGGTSAVLDSTAQRLYKPADKNLADWRRENVNRMIKAVYDTIQSVKPFVKFGVSPFGTWTTDQAVAIKEGIMLPTGVGTTGNMYAEIYCDPIAWLKEGSVDYVSPQLYWTTYSSYPYGKLAPWWSDITNRFGKHFYSSHSISALTAASSAPALKITKSGFDQAKTHGLSTLELHMFSRKSLTKIARIPYATDFEPSEVALQVGFNRSSDVNDAPGSVFYAADKLINTSGFISYLKQNVFTQPALTPVIGWKTSANQSLVENISLSGQHLTWTYAGSNVRFAIYAVPTENRNDVSVFADAKYLLGMAYNKEFDVPVTVGSSTHKIAVSVVDRYGNESSVRVLGENVVTSTSAGLVFPTDNTHVLFPCLFQWNAVENADSYVWQLSRNDSFTDLVCSRETKTPQFFSGLQTNLKNDVQYYWRVKTRKANAVDVWSDTRKVSGHKFRIIYPINGGSGVSLTPAFEWDSVSPNAVYTLEISTSVNFDAAKQVYSQTVQTSKFTLPADKLLLSTNYYARVSISDGAVKATSETVLFTTKDVEVPVPVIASPVSGATVFGKAIELCWNQQASIGFRAELSKDAAFPARATTVKSVDAYTFCATYDGLTSGTYYLRVKAVNSTGFTSPSTVISVILNDNTDVLQPGTGNIRCFVDKSGGQRKLIIKSEDAFEGQIALYSITGNCLTTKSLLVEAGQNTVALNLQQIPTGCYTLTVQTGQNIIPFKLIFN